MFLELDCRAIYKNKYFIFKMAQNNVDLQKYTYFADFEYLMRCDFLRKLYSDDPY